MRSTVVHIKLALDAIFGCLELMIGMLIVGYCFGIRSGRRLCEEVHLNLAYRWFCRLEFEDGCPPCV